MASVGLILLRAAKGGNSTTFRVRAKGSVQKQRCRCDRLATNPFTLTKQCCSVGVTTVLHLIYTSMSTLKSHIFNSLFQALNSCKHYKVTYFYMVKKLKQVLIIADWFHIYNWYTSHPMAAQCFSVIIRQITKCHITYGSAFGFKGMLHP